MFAVRVKALTSVSVSPCFFLGTPHSTKLRGALGQPTSHRFLTSLQMSGQRGDDLDDDFIPDELVASSGEEDTPFESRQGIDGFLSADDDADQDEPATKVAPPKRKRREKEKERQAKVTLIVQIPTTLTDSVSRRDGNSQKPSRSSNLSRSPRNRPTSLQTTCPTCKPRYFQTSPGSSSMICVSLVSSSSTSAFP